jgi:hypothetical protein
MRTWLVGGFVGVGVSVVACGGSGTPGSPGAAASGEAVGASSAALSASTWDARPWAHPASVSACFVNLDPTDFRASLVTQAMTTLFDDYPEFAIHFTGFDRCAAGARDDLRLAFHSSDPADPLEPPPPARDLLVLDLDPLPTDASFAPRLEELVLGRIAARSGAGTSDVVEFGSPSALYSVGIRLPRASVVRLREIYTTPLNAVAYVAAPARDGGRGTWLGVGEFPASDLQALIGDAVGSAFVGGSASLSVSGATGPVSAAESYLLPWNFVTLPAPYAGASASVTPMALALGDGAQFLATGGYAQADLSKLAGGRVDALVLPPGLAAILCRQVAPAGCFPVDSGASVDLSSPGSKLFVKPAITVFAGERFTGSSVTFETPQYYTPAAMAAIGGAARSLVVPPGLEVTACVNQQATALQWANGDGPCYRIGPQAGGAVSLVNLMSAPATILKVETERSAYPPLAVGGPYDCNANVFQATGTACTSVPGLMGRWTAMPIDDTTCSFAWASPVNAPADLRALVAETTPTEIVCEGPANQGPGLPGCQACGRNLPDSAGRIWNPTAGAYE